MPWKQAPGYTYEQRIGGLGPVWSWLGLPALLLLALVAARHRRVLLTALLAPVGVIFLVQPYQWWSRFTIVLGAVGLVALAWTIERCTPGAARALRGATLVLALAGAALASTVVDPSGLGRRLSAADVAGLVAEPAGERTLGRLFHREYRWLDDVPEHIRLGIELGAEPRFVYPAFGGNFGRRLDPLRAGRETELRQLLETGMLDYVFLGRGSILDRLASSRPGLVEIYADDRVAAYRRS